MSLIEYLTNHLILQTEYSGLLIYLESLLTIICNSYNALVISVCIPTYKRPALLTKLLHSLYSQDLPDETNLEIILVDNDPGKSAEIIVRKFSDTERITVRYYNQPVKNISITRNISIANAKGDFIFFIDDDEYASQVWIKNMLATQQKYQADGVFGSVRSYFSDDTPDYLRHCLIFNRPEEVTGEPARYLRTGNAMIKTELLKSVDGPFEESYGLTGGEDTKLLYDLKAKGAKFIYCSEAPVYELVPPERANLKYIFNRSLRNGNIFIRRWLECGNKSTTERIFKFIRSLLLLLVSIIMTILSLPVPKWAIWAYIKCAAYLGHLSAMLGIKIKGY
ncbi:MAG: glycosyltransferase family 2 protein [Ignavibacteriaceae bacterium]